MRQPVTAERLRQFIELLGQSASEPARVFLVGGATAVLLGWRLATIDVDLKVMPENDELFRLFTLMKEKLELNIELASPEDFIPAVPGWQERSQFICQKGKLTFLHYDFYAQALAKLERRHEIDLIDIKNFIREGLVECVKLRELFSLIEPNLHRYPAINPDSFRQALEDICADSLNQS